MAPVAHLGLEVLGYLSLQKIQMVLVVQKDRVGLRARRCPRLQANLEFR